MREMVATMSEYNTWANDRVVECAARLGPEQYRVDGGASFGSVHDTLVHVMGAQWLWLSRWKGVFPRALPAPSEFRDLDALRHRWAEVEREARAFLAGLTEADLARPVSYLNTEGERWAYPLWQQMLHQVNHGTQHRSEVAMVLTRFGQSPGWLDFLYYMDVRATAA
ncbi:MAG TPA: DinB family protein [Candidatus Bathyarchaeia archaeon]|nr:DinB family protein [Candidatus Bathyarchaeia archaeon]